MVITYGEDGGVLLSGLGERVYQERDFEWCLRVAHVQLTVTSIRKDVGDEIDDGDGADR